jgi:hypothetical protein
MVEKAGSLAEKGKGMILSVGRV